MSCLNSQKNRVEELESIIERWCFFFKYTEDTTDEDLRNIAEKSSIIKLAYDELDKFHWNEKDLLANEERIWIYGKKKAILAQKLDDATKKVDKKASKSAKKEAEKKGKLKLLITYLKQEFLLISELKLLVFLELKLHNSKKKSRVNFKSLSRVDTDILKHI